MHAPRYSLMPSPVGRLRLLGDGEALCALYLEDEDAAAPDPQYRRDDGVFAVAREQLQAYFAGHLRLFDLPLAAGGTPFQQTVWRALREIPYGQTLSYGELAARIGQPGAARAVGLANGQNPLAIVVPCHRVIGARGALTGYAGGLARKRWLLTHEASHRGGGLFG